MHFVTFVRVYNMHQDTKSARLIAVCKRTFRPSTISSITCMPLNSILCVRFCFFVYFFFKISELYDLVTKWDATADVVPELVSCEKEACKLFFNKRWA